MLPLIQRCSFVLLLSAAIAPCQEVMIDFEAKAAGASVEGLNAVSPILTITSSTGAAKIVQTGSPLAQAFGAPNSQLALSGARNNCLEDANGQRVNRIASPDLTANGFADLATTRQHNYTIAFHVAINTFKIRMFDFGDFNPDLQTTHKVTATAYNSLNQVVDTDTLQFGSTTGVNPPEYYLSGDACSSTFGQPGYYEFSLPSATQPIAYVKIQMDPTGDDPNVAFDSIRVYRTGEDGCTPGYWKNHTDAWSGIQPNALLKTVFPTAVNFNFPKNGGVLGDQTFLMALQFKGGSDAAGAASILLRSAVAALLNASSPAFYYAIPAASVISMVEAALQSGDRDAMLNAASILDGYNNANCTINAHYVPPPIG